MENGVITVNTVGLEPVDTSPKPIPGPGARPLVTDVEGSRRLLDLEKVIETDCACAAEADNPHS